MVNGYQILLHNSGPGSATPNSPAHWGLVQCETQAFSGARLPEPVRRAQKSSACILDFEHFCHSPEGSKWAPPLHSTFGHESFTYSWIMFNCLNRSKLKNGYSEEVITVPVHCQIFLVFQPRRWPWPLVGQPPATPATLWLLVAEDTTHLHSSPVVSCACMSLYE